MSPQTAAQSSRTVWLRRTFVAVAIVSALYAPIAFTDLFPYRFAGAPRIGESILARAVSPEYMETALATRLEPYRDSWLAMTIHAVVGSLLMIAGPLQLLSAVRQRKRLHRAVGVFYATAVLVSMAGAAVYLARTPVDQVFSGAIFAFALGAILLGTVTAVGMGVIEIVSGRPQNHQRWMVLSYAYLMTAPLLRFEWASLPVIFPGLTMDEINRIGTMSMGGVVAFVAVLVSRALDPRDRVRHLEGSWAPTPVVAGAGVAGLVTVALMTVVVAGFGEAQQWRQFGAFLLPYAIACVVAVMLWRRAIRWNRSWPAEEWAVQLTALALVPVVALAITGVVHFALGFEMRIALATGLAIGWGATTLFAVMATTGRLTITELMSQQRQRREARAAVLAQR